MFVPCDSTSLCARRPLLTADRSLAPPLATASYSACCLPLQPLLSAYLSIPAFIVSLERPTLGFLRFI